MIIPIGDANLSPKLLHRGVMSEKESKLALVVTELNFLYCHVMTMMLFVDNVFPYLFNQLLLFDTESFVLDDFQ